MNNDYEVSLSTKLGESIQETVNNTVELIIDSSLQDGLLKDIPIVSYVSSAYRIVQDVKGLHYLKKLGIFLTEFNKKVLDNGVYQKYKDDLYNNSKFRSREIEYLLIILEKILEERKAVSIARIYFAYIEKKVSWDELQTLCIITERLFPADYEIINSDNNAFVTSNNVIDERYLRLLGLGMMVETTNTSTFHSVNENVLAITHESFDIVYNKKRVFEKTGLCLKYKHITDK